MLTTCPECGKYTVETPCYQCLAAERDHYRRLAGASVATLAGERDKYKRLYEMAMDTCPRCRENCAIRRLSAPKAAGE